jgi:curli biogenesis system outer membrane secretion channel CsgG
MQALSYAMSAGVGMSYRLASVGLAGTIALFAFCALGQTPSAKPGTPASQGVGSPKPSAPPKKAPAASTQELTANQILQLVKAKLPESVILAKIRTYGKPVKHTEEDLIRLREAGASEAILLALVDPTAAPSPTPEPRQEPAGETRPEPQVAPAGAPPPEPAAAAQPSDVAPPATQPVPASGVSGPTAKRRLIVDEFEYGTVKKAVQAIFGTDQDIGKGIRARLVTRLAASGKVTVLERAKLGDILREQEFGASDRVQRGTGARLGRIKGADAILTGSIVVFGRDDRAERKGGGGGIGGFFGGLVKWKKAEKAVVAIDYRLVDAETTEVIDTGEARGESKRESGGWGGLLVVAGAGGAAAKDMQSSNFDETIIGEAVLDCVNKLADIIIQKLEKLPPKKIEIEGRVADVSGSTLVITAGSNEGVQVGDRFSVERIVREVRDPATKELLDVVTQKIGELTVQEVRTKVSIGSFTGASPPKVNDLVRKITR